MAVSTTTRATANRALANAEHLTNGLDNTLAENRKTLHSLLGNANDAANSVAGLTEELKTTLGDKNIKNSLTTSSQNLTAATANLTAISTKLDATASDVQRLADDPRLNANVRETVDNLRASSESVRNLAQRLEGIHIPGEKRRNTNVANETPSPPHYFSSTSLLEPGLVFDSLYDTKVERLRFDADYTLLTGKPGSFYRIGIFDATYNNRLNLEAGQGLFGNRADYRYGLIDGKFGAGIDFRAGPLDFRFDAYDPQSGNRQCACQGQSEQGRGGDGGHRLAGQRKSRDGRHPDTKVRKAKRKFDEGYTAHGRCQDGQGRRCRHGRRRLCAQLPVSAQPRGSSDRRRA